MPEVLRELERQVLARLRNGRILEDISGRSWVLGGQQFVSHFSAQQLETAMVVVFDLIDILCPDTDQTSAGIRAAWKSMRNIRAARTVVTISEYSRQRIIGLYPIDPTLYPERWAAGKSGLKGIQYMAVGIPFVATPVGAMQEIGKAGVTHLHALTNVEWQEALKLLLFNPELRRAMGTSGRHHVVEHYSLSEQAEKLAQALHEASARAVA